MESSIRSSDTVKEQEPTDVTDGARISYTAKSASRTITALPEKATISEKHLNPAWPFESSQTNYDIVKKEYSKSPLEKYVATAVGDELPGMRDALIKLKHSGEGFLERHIHAWSTPENWKVDPDNDMKEKSDPIHCDQDSDSTDICK